MKRYRAHFITVLGILSFLSVPTTPVAGINRDIASVMEENATFPRYEAFALKIKPESIQEEKDLLQYSKLCLCINIFSRHLDSLLE